MKNILSRYFFSLTLLLLNGFCISGFAQDSSIQSYIQKYKAIAEEEMERTGVPAAISLAQGIVESQAGQGWLVEHSHNHFGIKCKSDWTGPTIAYDDDRKNECFRVYETDDSSWRDHSDFLRASPRYAFLFQLDPLDYQGWAYGLKKAGYATSKVYAEKVIAYIEKYNLQDYSKLALARIKKPKANAFAVMLDKKIREDKNRMGIIEQDVAPEVKKPEAEPSPYPSGPFAINGRRVLYLPAGTQLIGVADKYHIRLSKLLRFNELSSDVLSAPALIFLQKKGKKGAHDIHVVGAGETLASIAAKEGIQLKWLYKWNGLSKQDPLTEGEALYLQQYRPEDNNIPSGKQEKKGFFAGLAKLFSGKQGQKKSVAADQRKEEPEDINQGGTATMTQQNPASVVDKPVEIGGIYRVQTGDTLYSISRKYNISVSQIKQWNNLEGDAIQVGQQLTVKK